MSKNFAFRVEIDGQIGMGHYKRLISLSEQLGSKNISWFISGDRVLASLLLRNKSFFYLGVSKKKSLEDLCLKYIEKKNITKIVLDLSYKDNLKNNKILSIIKFYKKNNILVTSFDDPRHKITSDVSIIPYQIKKKSLNIVNKNSKIFLGLNYFFFSKKILNIHNNNFKKKINNILIFISASDKGNIGYKILKLIITLNCEIILITNIKNIPAINRQLKVFISSHPTKSLNKIKIIPLTNNFEKYLKWSDLIISGEGLVKYEAIFLNKPLILVHVNDNNSETIKIFLSKNACLSLGKYKDYLENDYKQKMLSYILDYKTRLVHFKNSNSFFDKKNLLTQQKKLISTLRKLEIK